MTEEWELRVQLAAAYRLTGHFDWPELIWTHTTVRVPGPERHFPINPYGYWFDEVCASDQSVGIGHGVQVEGTGASATHR